MSGAIVTSPSSVRAFYRDLLFELGEHAQRGGTAFGAAVVAKRVALAHGLAVAESVPLPRPTRAERDELAWLARSSGGRTADSPEERVSDPPGGPAIGPSAARSITGEMTRDVGSAR